MCSFADCYFFVTVTFLPPFLFLEYNPNQTRADQFGSSPPPRALIQHHSVSPHTHTCKLTPWLAHRPRVPRARASLTGKRVPTPVKGNDPALLLPRESERRTQPSPRVHLRWRSRTPAALGDPAGWRYPFRHVPDDRVVMGRVLCLLDHLHRYCSFLPWTGL